MFIVKITFIFHSINLGIVSKINVGNRNRNAMCDKIWKCDYW